MGVVTVRGNMPVLFLLFFSATTLLAGAMYLTYQLYAASAGATVYGLATAASAIGFVFSLMITARILYKAAA